MIKINLTELRVEWYQVLSGVLHGKIYLIYREGRPIAQLSPVLPAPPPEAVNPAVLDTEVMLDPDIAATVEQLSRVFGPQGLGQALGTSLALVQRAGRTGILPTYLLLRLDLLQELWRAFEASVPPRDFSRWFGQPQRVLGGRSPQAVLRGAWQPDSPQIQRLLALIREPERG